jgi:aminoglycoside phosphotransferase (APT) family kinase protein
MIQRWLPDAVPPFTVTRLPGGNSNRTERIVDATGQSWVLRRPPAGAALATAHDVLREARILRAVAAGVPVPRVLATDAEPMVLMEYVDGITCRDSTAAAALPAPVRQRAGRSLAETLAALHRLDPDEIGLGDLGRREDYVRRQLARWHRQWQAAKQRELPALERAFNRLSEAVPPQRRSAVVHGDYRLDNCILAADGSVRAVLDWEICALGDPLADLGVLLAYWAEPGDAVRALEDPPTAVEGFSSRDELRAVYLDAAGLPADTDVAFHVAFAWWKLACIVEGVYARAVRTPPVSGRSAASYAEQAARLADHAGQLAGELS